jgi:molybdopterin synthase catalytic subunit
MVFTDVTTKPIDADEVLARVGAGEDGAVLLFLGVVRNHAEGRAVDGMRYDAYEEMARSVLAEIAREASERHGTDRLAVVHRVGGLKLGETSVAIAVSTPHRAEAYAANREIIEEIKKRLPVWKEEHYVDGSSAWVEGVVPPLGAPGGRTA